MKKGLLFLLLLSSGLAKAQTLKDALFSGKLKNQPGSVIRKGDDLSTKIDTAQKTTPVETVQTTPTQPGIDSSSQNVSAPTNMPAAVATDSNNISADSINTTAPTSAAVSKNNNTVWKTYMDSVASGLKTEVLSSKKVKKGDYFVLVTYTIAMDGQTTVSDVSLSPENAYLQQQIKVRLDSDTPRLSPVLNGAGAPRKAIKKYSFTLTKE